MPNSIINSGFIFDDETWALSIVNTCGSRDSSPKLRSLPGHSALILEGVENNREFIFKYDIQFQPYENDDSSLNTKGQIIEVRISNNPDRVNIWSNYPGTTYNVHPARAREMIDSIENDQQQVRDSLVGLAEPIEYQLLDRTHLLARLFNWWNSETPQIRNGRNCTGWCLDKMAIAGVGDGNAKAKPVLRSSWSLW